MIPVAEVIAELNPQRASLLEGPEFEAIVEAVVEIGELDERFEQS